MASTSHHHHSHDFQELTSIVDWDHIAELFDAPKECGLPGCRKRCAQDSSGKKGYHGYCTRRHAAADRIRLPTSKMKGEIADDKPETECCLPECHREKFKELRPEGKFPVNTTEGLTAFGQSPGHHVAGDGDKAVSLADDIHQLRYEEHFHGYCCLSHFNEAVRRGLCSVPGCNRFVYIDNMGTSKQRVHDYCGRTCANRLGERKETLEILQKDNDAQKAKLRELLHYPLYHPVKDSATGEQVSRLLDVHMNVFQYGEDKLRELKGEPFWTRDPANYRGLTSGRMGWRKGGGKKIFGSGDEEDRSDGLIRQTLTTIWLTDKTAAPWKMEWYYVGEPSLVIAYIVYKPVIKAGRKRQRGSPKQPGCPNKPSSSETLT